MSNHLFTCPYCGSRDLPVSHRNLSREMGQLSHVDLRIATGLMKTLSIEGTSGMTRGWIGEIFDILDELVPSFREADSTGDPARTLRMFQGEDDE